MNPILHPRIMVVARTIIYVVVFIILLFGELIYKLSAKAIAPLITPPKDIKNTWFHPILSFFPLNKYITYIGINTLTNLAIIVANITTTMNLGITYSASIDMALIPRYT